MNHHLAFFFKKSNFAQILKILKMSTIFTKIINGEIPCYKIAENDDYFAFLDINPMAKGHTLVVTKAEVDYIINLTEEQTKGLFAFVRRIALALKKLVPCKTVSIFVLGIDVPHTHVHLIPFNTIEDVNFKKPALKLSKEEFEHIAQQISANVEL